MVAGGVVHVAATTGTVSAFDTAAGAPRWIVETGAEVLHPVHLAPLGDQYLEHGLAVLPGDGILHVRTSAGLVALRQPPARGTEDR
ncbi:hypothetical protein [Actinomadura kijaniata]|uniref:hypothetical protein n=1 Tax=Actinomadura kijaniata TaxID=46161 RepID=UPI000830FBEB|nr:hypothetical protein [Actinomadura kijaniata]